MKRTILALSAGGLAALLGPAACSRAGDATATGTLALTGPGATSAVPAPSAAPGAPVPDCAHAACADNFFIDAVPGDCAAGAPCTVTLKLVATGAFHINDEYPYKFKADDAPGVQFLGTDPSGPNAFTKTAGNWQKSAEKTGAMAVQFTPAAAGVKAISGTLRLSVCSAQNCLLDQRQVSASVVAK